MDTKDMRSNVFRPEEVVYDVEARNAKMVN